MELIYVYEGYIRESISPCVVPAFMEIMKDGKWLMCINGQTIK